MVRAKSRIYAMHKTIDLGIHPKHDDIAIYEMASPEQMKLNRLYTPKEMDEMTFFERDK